MNTENADGRRPDLPFLEPFMPDISKHPVLRQISELMHAIEVCGASPELTRAVCLAEALYQPVEALVDSKTAVLTDFDPSTDTAIERVIREVGADVAPRVTPDQIDALMARVVYTYDERPNGSTVTFAHALLDGSFFLASGTSACVSAANYKSEIGRKLASENAARAARDKLWELEGYLLRATMAADVEFIGGSMAITD